MMQTRGTFACSRNSEETVSVGIRSIPELAMFVEPCRPYTAIVLQQHIVESPRSQSLDTARNDLHKTGDVAAGPIPELTVIVPPCGPHTSVLLQHHAVGIACSHVLYTARDCLHETATVHCPLVLLFSGSIPELTVLVPSRDPHTAILLQHHAVGITQRQFGRACKDKSRS